MKNALLFAAILAPVLATPGCGNGREPWRQARSRSMAVAAT